MITQAEALQLVNVELLHALRYVPPDSDAQDKIERALEAIVLLREAISTSTQLQAENAELRRMLEKTQKNFDVMLDSALESLSKLIDKERII